MILDPRQGRRFIDLMLPLQFFVNRKLKIVAGIDSQEAYRDLSTQEKVPVRDALYEHSELIDAYVAENPLGLEAADLETVQGWKNFKQGKFLIERQLKKYAVFISDDHEVFGVLAIGDPFDLLLGGARLPVMVSAVLLPFDGKIVSDGMIGIASVTFGAGIRRNLRDIYLAAKQKGGIRTCLGHDRPPAVEMIRSDPAADWGRELDRLAGAAQKLKTRQNYPAVVLPAFQLVKASLALAQAAVASPADMDALWNKGRKANLALRRIMRSLDPLDR